MRKDWFSDCTTQEEVKSKYRKLCKRYHPDLGGDVKTMQDINAAFAIANDNAVRREKPDWTEEQYRSASVVAECIREAIEKIITVPGLDIEICGLWVWVGGETKAAKEELKEAGYKWASKKKKWYFAGVPAGGFGWSMTKIRAHYGSKKVRSKAAEKEEEKKKKNVPAFA